jgi:hypothetical protein
MPPRNPARYDAPIHTFVGGALGAGKTRAAMEVIPHAPDIWHTLWPEDPAPGGEWSGGRWNPQTPASPQEFSRFSQGDLSLLARGRGVSSTVEIGGEPHLVAALISSKEGHVWICPTIKEVAAKAHAIQGECWQALAAPPGQFIPPQTASIAKGPIRVIKVPRNPRQGPGWYVYLCVPLGAESPPPEPEPKKRSQSRFKNLEL